MTGDSSVHPELWSIILEKASPNSDLTRNHGEWNLNDGMKMTCRLPVGKEVFHASGTLARDGGLAQ